MNFSYEEIYAEYGQYDVFVVLEFYNSSDTYNCFERFDARC